MRRYETIFITHPELAEEELSELHEKLNSIVTGFKGELIKLEDWGIKKMSYEIRKNNRGHFFLMDYAAGLEVIRELERNLRLNDRVLRFQTVRISGEASPEAIRAWKDAAAKEKGGKTGERSAAMQEEKGEGVAPKGE